MIKEKNCKLKIFSGTSNPKLAADTAGQLGKSLEPIDIKRFADGEISVNINVSIRGADVYLLASTCPPVNENLMELLIMVDAARRASAKTITAVIPYFGYARSDRKTEKRQSIVSKLSANLLTCAGIDKIICIDLHSEQCIGFFDTPCDNIYGDQILLNYIQQKNLDEDRIVVVSPDVGGIKRARQFAKRLNDSPIAIVDKRRPYQNVSEVIHIVGDVKDKIVILVDDMIDTGGTIYNTAIALRNQGCLDIYVLVSHSLFSGKAVERLSSDIFKEIVVLDTVPLNKEKMFNHLTVLSASSLLSNHIWKIQQSNYS